MALVPWETVGNFFPGPKHVYTSREKVFPCRNMAEYYLSTSTPRGYRGWALCHIEAFSLTGDSVQEQEERGEDGRFTEKLFIEVEPQTKNEGTAWTPFGHI